MKRAAGLFPEILIVPVFYVVAVWLWRSTGSIFYLFNFVYIGTAIGIGMVLAARVLRERHGFARRVTQFLIGLYMLGFLGLLERENMQIEGFWLYLFSGFFAGAVIHYAAAKIAGPLIFGRGWCGWACWTAMVLDLLPFKESHGRVPRLGRLRYVHFGISLGIALLAWFAFTYRPLTDTGLAINELYWLLAGNALYYATGIALAFGFRDNRAFCKYLCPIAVFLKTTSRFALLKVRGDPVKCNMCGLCEKACPMDIRIRDYITAGTRVLSTECILCQTCISTCQTGALRVTVGLDLGGREFVHQQGRSR